MNFLFFNELSMYDKKGEIVEENSFYADLMCMKGKAFFGMVERKGPGEFWPKLYGGEGEDLP